MMLRGLVSLLMLAFAAYPLFAASLVAIDSLAGERLFSFYAAYERRLLVETFVADYIASLPLMLVITLAIAGVAFALQRVLARRTANIAVMAGGVIAAFATATLVTGTTFSGVHLVLVIDIVAYCAVMNFLVPRFAPTSTSRARA
jgi:hypothetical protein